MSYLRKLLIIPKCKYIIEKNVLVIMLITMTTIIMMPTMMSILGVYNGFLFFFSFFGYQKKSMITL